MRRLVLLVALASSSVAAQVRYTVTFESTWSERTHPADFPGASAHYSGLVGATHDAATQLWAAGQPASPGIESMAETGAKTLLLAEVDARIADGAAEFALSGEAIATSPGRVELSFRVTEERPYVSLVSMIAPSPDWFVGVSGLALRDESGWRPEVVVPLYVYDAGTDSGASYTSADADTDPAAPIARIEKAPFRVGDAVVPVGTFTFALQRPVDAETTPGRLTVTPAAPNPARTTVGFRVTGASQEPVALAVFDALGRQVVARTDAGVRIQIDTRAWAPGVYVAQISQGTARVTRRFAVSR